MTATQPQEGNMSYTLTDDERYRMELGAYYFTLDTTGCDVVDSILAAVLRAGKMAHHTESWGDAEHWDAYGGSPVEHIQAAANRAAETLRAADAEVERLRHELTVAHSHVAELLREAQP